MIKNNKKYLKNIVRRSGVYVDKNSIRLDKSERVNEFPKNLFLEFRDSLDSLDFIMYPDVQPLINTISTYENVNKGGVVITNGSDQGIKMMFETFATKGANIITTDPCFPMYDVYSQLFETSLVKVRYESDLKYSLEKIVDAVNSLTSFILLANPNNPVGDVKSVLEIEWLIKTVRTKYPGLPIVIDEAYFEYSKITCKPLLTKYDNLIILRTFSKAMGAAGIRLGYILSSNEIVQLISKWRPMYDASGISIKFGIWIFNNIEVVDEYVENTIKERNLIFTLLKESGIEVINTHTNWLHINPGQFEDKIIEIFKKNKILYKSATQIPHDSRSNWIRLTVGDGVSKMNFINDINLLEK